jgi:membrane protein implicated in regulation of membrane protease activity
VARDSVLIGKIGVLIVATRGAAGPGEVQVAVRGGTEVFIAWSPEPLPKGTSVLVIESRGHRAVDVSRWDDPLADFPASTDT